MNVEHGLPFYFGTCENNKGQSVNSEKGMWVHTTTMYGLPTFTMTRNTCQVTGQYATAVLMVVGDQRLRGKTNKNVNN